MQITVSTSDIAIWHVIGYLDCHVVHRVEHRHTRMLSAQLKMCMSVTQQQAADDWVTVLTHRYHELKHGGILSVNFIAVKGRCRTLTVLTATSL